MQSGLNNTVLAEDKYRCADAAALVFDGFLELVALFAAPRKLLPVHQVTLDLPQLQHRSCISQALLLGRHNPLLSRVGRTLKANVAQAKSVQVNRRTTWASLQPERYQALQGALRRLGTCLRRL